LTGQLSVTRRDKNYVNAFSKVKVNSMVTKKASILNERLYTKINALTNDEPDCCHFSLP